MLKVIGLTLCGFLETQSTIITSLLWEGYMGVTALVLLMMGLMVLQMNTWSLPKFLNIHLIKTYLVWQKTHIGLLTCGVRAIVVEIAKWKPLPTRVVNQRQYCILERMTEMSSTLNDLNNIKVVVLIIIACLIFAKPDGSRHKTVNYRKHNQVVASNIAPLSGVQIIAASGRGCAATNLVNAFFH